MHTDPKARRLSELAPFAGASKKALLALSRLADETDHPAGSYIARQGHRGGEAFIIEEGTVAIVRDGVEVAEVGTGAVVGEVALLQHTQRNADLVARTPLRLLVFEARDFDRLLDEFPQLGASIRQDAATRFSGTEPSPA